MHRLIKVKHTKNDSHKQKATLGGGKCLILLQKNRKRVLAILELEELLSVSNHYAIRQNTDVSYSFSPPFMVCFIIYLTDDKIKRLSNSPDRKKKMRQILT